MFCRRDLVNFDSLALELLVVKEESAQYREPMLGHLAGLAVGIVFRIPGSDGDDLMVLLARVNHRHQADSTSLDDRKRHNRLLAQNEHIKRVIVFGEGL